MKKRIPTKSRRSKAQKQIASLKAKQRVSSVSRRKVSKLPR